MRGGTRSAFRDWQSAGGWTSSTARPSAARFHLRRCRWSLPFTTSPSCATRRRSTQWTRRYSRLYVPRVARAASRIIAVSEFTKRELVELFGMPPEKVTVIPNGVADVFSPDGPAAEGDYVLTVGTLEPRKNLERVQEAARLAAAELRVVGARGWGGVQGLRAGTRLRRRARSPLPRREVRRLCVAVRGLRPAHRRGDGLRDAGGHEPGRRDGGDGRRRRRARRPVRPGRDRLGHRRSGGATRRICAGSASSVPAPSRGMPRRARRRTSTGMSAG